jgi:quercetin dioxygenase-like cupin family protein
MRKTFWPAAAAALLLAAGAAHAYYGSAPKAAAKPASAATSAAKSAPAPADHAMFTPATMKWGPAPPAFPAGMEMAVVQGDPFGNGLYTLQAKLPAGYKIPPHFHPTDEHVTVLSGGFYMGTGDTLDAAHSSAMPPGSFMLMKAGTHHFGWAKTPAVIQVHGMGPFAITYVNPADDPRTAKK